MADETIVTPATFTPPEAPAASTPPAADVRTEIDTLATEYGYDPSVFSGINDLEAARTAIKLAIETTASRRFGGQSITASDVNLPADRFSKPQSEPTAQSVQQWQSIDYKALGLDEEDAAAKALKLQEQNLKATYDRMAALEARNAEAAKHAAQREEQMIMAQAEEVISGYASPRYGTMQHRTRIQETQFNKLLEMAAVIRENSNHSLSLKACLNQARLLDEGTVAASKAALPPQKPAGSVLSQGGAPSLGDVAPKMRMTDKFTDNPEIREKLGLPPRDVLR